jgi:hypothetical protein
MPCFFFVWIFEIECQFQEAWYRVVLKRDTGTATENAHSGCGGLIAVPTELLFPLGIPQRFSFCKATPNLLTFILFCGII